jgi:hypothetical protein
MIIELINQYRDITGNALRTNRTNGYSNWNINDTDTIGVEPTKKTH